MDTKKFLKNKLAKYRECQQKLKIIESDEMDIIEGNFGVSYDQPATGKTNSKHDSTFNKTKELLKSQEGDTWEEYLECARYVHKVNLALQGLTKAERFIIKRKYCLVDLMDEDITFKPENNYVYNVGEVPDKAIYNHDRFPHGDHTYFEIKKEGEQRLKRLLG